MKYDDGIIINELPLTEDFSPDRAMPRSSRTINNYLNRELP